MLNTMNHSYC